MPVPVPGSASGSHSRGLRLQGASDGGPGKISQLAAIQQDEEESLHRAMAEFRLSGRSKGRHTLTGFR